MVVQRRNGLKEIYCSIDLKIYQKCVTVTDLQVIIYNVIHGDYKVVPLW